MAAWCIEMDAEAELRRAQAADLSVVHRAEAASIQDDNAAAGVNWTWIVLEVSR